MAEPTLDDVKARARAVADLEDISALRGTPAFARYFERRIADELKKLSDLLLYDRGQTKETLWETRQRFLATFDVSQIVAQDEASCTKMLSEGADE